MIDLQSVWLPQILTYARLLGETEILQRAWVEGDGSQTSVTDPSELFEQVFDDLDSETMLEHARVEIDDKELVSRLDGFVKSLLMIERGLDESQPLEQVFGSEEWRSAARAARDLLAHARLSRVEPI